MHRTNGGVAIALIAMAAGFVRAQQGQPLRVVQDKETIAVFAGDRQVMEYRHVQSPLKPYASKLFSPGGAQVLRDSPSDHKHHHALMFAVAADNVNFWEETQGAGIQRPRSVKLIRPNASKGAGLVQELDWVDTAGNRTLLAEQRTVEVLQSQDAGATLLAWTTRLAPSGKEPASLGGSHYFGLGMRFPISMDKGGRFFNAESLEGEVVRGTERLTPARWCAYTADADGKVVTVALFDHPSNLRHPARMFTMTAPFAYLAGTLNLWKEPYVLEPGRTLTLIYGVAVWDGTVEPGRIEALYRKWAK
jgi:hypothetical protein